MFKIKSLALLGIFASSLVLADTQTDYFREGQELMKRGQNFEAARYFFNASIDDSGIQPLALAKTTEALINADYPNSAFYFFVKTLQSGHQRAIRNVLKNTAELMAKIDPDVVRIYLLKYTKLEDYEGQNRDYYLFYVAKDLLSKGKANEAKSYIDKIDKNSSLGPKLFFAKASADLIAGDVDAAISNFKTCINKAENQSKKRTDAKADLSYRCYAGLGRAYYEKEKYNEATLAYAKIDKGSFVWTDILFEEAWSAFGRAEYNLTLGKLVTYKSPSFRFVFNPEVDVLRAQTFLAMCLYDDANKEVDKFNEKYKAVGVEIKDFLTQNENNISKIYEAGAKAARSSLHSGKMFDAALNRFARSQTFMNFIEDEDKITEEYSDLKDKGKNDKFAEFLKNVLSWRLKSIRLLGGLFIKNTLYATYKDVLASYDKMNFIKLDLLGKAKEKLQSELKQNVLDSVEGDLKYGSSILPNVRDNQFFWVFNGEYWNDEIGDYVYGLASECKK